MMRRLVWLGRRGSGCDVNNAAKLARAVTPAAVQNSPPFVAEAKTCERTHAIIIRQRCTLHSHMHYHFVFRVRVNDARIREIKPRTPFDGAQNTCQDIIGRVDQKYGSRVPDPIGI